eukprot:GHVR01035029.1.p1 GENE.GHVR01035029.1~~GHVR01035029.1.p1  ORF type:complete len:330 (-),score=28.20 GHVR01035029.1:247-1200(-)
MKFTAILSLVPSYVLAQDIFCVYTESGTNDTEKCDANDAAICGKLGSCVIIVSDIGIKYVSGHYAEHSITGGACVSPDEKVEYGTTEKVCKSIVSSNYSVKQEIAPTKYCYYNKENCGDADLLNCTESSTTCVRYGYERYVKIDSNALIRAYSDNACSKEIFSGSTTTIVRTDECKGVGMSGMYAKAVASTTTKASPGEYLCSFTGDCKTVEKCNKTADGCQMVEYGAYLKRNEYTNKVELHDDDKCPDYRTATSAAVGTDCTNLLSTRYVMFSATDLSVTTTTSTPAPSLSTSPSTSVFNLSYLAFAVIAILAFSN